MHGNAEKRLLNYGLVAWSNATCPEPDNARPDASPTGKHARADPVVSAMHAPHPPPPPPLPSAAAAVRDALLSAAGARPGASIEDVARYARLRNASFVNRTSPSLQAETLRVR